jgi:hypothetical protein
MEWQCASSISVGRRVQFRFGLHETDELQYLPIRLRKSIYIYCLYCGLCDDVTVVCVPVQPWPRATGQMILSA